MAAGISLRGETVDAFREKINACCELTDQDFIPKIRIDIAMPAEYPDEALVRQLSVLEPFGKGNTKPLFADKGLAVRRAVIAGRNRNVLKLALLTARGAEVSAVYFGDICAWKDYYTAEYGERAVEDAFLGRENDIRMSVVYYPEINSYQGRNELSLVIRHYQ